MHCNYCGRSVAICGAGECGQPRSATPRGTALTGLSVRSPASYTRAHPPLTPKHTRAKLTHATPLPNSLPPHKGRRARAEYICQLPGGHIIQRSAQPQPGATM